MARQETNQPIRVRVNRAFLLNGEIKAVGDEVALPPALASELYGAGKIERADHEPSEFHKQALADAKAKAVRKGLLSKPVKAAAQAAA